MTGQKTLRTGFRIALLSMSVAVIGLAFSLSRQAEGTLRDFRASIDALGLKNATETFLELDVTARDIAAKVLNNRATVLLSLAPTLDTVTEEFYLALLRMRDLELPFVHSINVINVPTGEIITTNRGWYRVNENILADLEQTHPELPVFTPLPVTSKVSYGDQEELVFAYLVRERYDDEPGLARGAIVLIRSAWFLEAIALSDDPRTGTRFMLYHPAAGIMTSEPSEDLVTVEREIIARGAPSGVMFQLRHAGTRYSVELFTLGSTGLQLVRVRDVSLLSRELLLLRGKSAGLSVLVLIAVILMGIAVNRRFYGPYYSAVADIRESLGDRISLPESDLELLSSLYSSLRDEFSGGGDDRVVSDCLRALTLTDENKRTESIEVLGNRGISFTDGREASLLLVAVDDIDRGDMEAEGASALSSYASVMYQVRQAIHSNMEDHQVEHYVSAILRGRLLILCFAPSGVSLKDDLHSRLGALSDHSISVVESLGLTSFHDIRVRHPRLVAGLGRRYLLGQGICIDDSNTGEAPTESQQSDAESLRRAVIQAIEAREPSSEAIGDYIDALRGWETGAAMEELYLCSLAVMHALSVAGRITQSQELLRILVRQESVTEFKQLLEALDEADSSVTEKESRHAAIALAAREIVETRFADPGLSLRGVAEELGMSATYFGLVFRRLVGSTFPDYLTMVRIQEAARLLVETRMSVQEVMPSVGILSESTFYRRFREYFSITPQNYRIQTATRKVAGDRVAGRINRG